MKLSNLNERQLKRVISDANVALARRQKIEKAKLDIQRILIKEKFTSEELKALLSSLQAPKSSATYKTKKIRSKVKAKYQSKDGSETWTGRGRSPKWVVAICKKEGITIEEFKTRSQNLISTKNSSSL